MSSALTTLVPIMTGPNYQSWLPMMRNFLMSQKQWRILSKPEPSPVAAVEGQDATETEPAVQAVSSNEDDIEDWRDTNDQALGNVFLRLAPAIQHRFREETNAGSLWRKLEKAYGKPGISVMYLEFKSAIETTIPEHGNPTQALDKMMLHFGRLRDFNLEIPEHLQTMIILSKLPSAYDSLTQILSQADDPAEFTFEKLQRAVILAWEQRSGSRTRTNRQNDSAKKITAVKRPQGKPTFQQQLENNNPGLVEERSQERDGQRGRGRGRGNRGRRGTRGGKKDKQRAQNIDDDDNCSHLSYQNSEQGNFEFQIANAVTIARPPPPPPPQAFRAPWFPPTSAVPAYPDFAAAHALTKQLGLRPTIETVKGLEVAAMTSTDPRPQKRRRVIDENEVDIFGSDYGDDILMENEAGPSGTTHRYAFTSLPSRNGTDDVAATNHNKDNKQTRQTVRAGKLSVTPYPHVARNTPLSCLNMGEHNPETEVKWLLDSGASRHFTYDINDFVEYKTITPMPLLTANGRAEAIGQGTVILVLNDKAIRINGVLYVPDLTTRLLSLGQFHKSGLHSRGSDRQISLYDVNTKKEFVTFYPRNNQSTLYEIWAQRENPNSKYLQTIYKIDFETMHKRLAHPSDDVLRKAPDNTKGFPDIDYSRLSKSPTCPGCAQGKMTQKPFPPSDKRASEPFELIHSDLKSFPIESYRKYKYSIVYYDDYTSQAWTINLRTKDAALAATKQFIAMVETQYQARIVSWKSDAGGEYTSKAFTEMLKDRGIKVLQSVPHAHQQNGRAERLIRTLMDKAESIRHQACLPQSWWEFALDHATHVYNRTPMRRLGWSTPYQKMTSQKPTIDHLRVFGCGAYVFIPAEVRKNKLSPKSELMTYLGCAPGGNGWLFMRGPNNILFTAAQATFDEGLFPRCPKSHGARENTRLQTPMPKQRSCPDKGCVTPPEDDSWDEPPRRASIKGKARQTPLSRSEIEPRQGEIQPEVPPDVPAAPVPRRSGRAVKVPKRPGNVYGDKHPVQIEKEIARPRAWRDIVGESSSRPRRAVPAKPVVQPPPVPVADSEDEVHDSLEPSSSGESEKPLSESSDSEEEAALARLCREGGAALSHFLLHKALVTGELSSETYDKPPKEWTYKDILVLPPNLLSDWRQACARELSTLQKRNVFDLVRRPRGRKVIKNRWVFDIKDDGRKRARLVAKGFSQVEGLDYDQVFSPVVRFETMRLILAMAAIEGWVAHGLDVRNAYLYGELDEEIYMEQPEGFRIPGKEDFVLLLKKALYGLKQAGLAWWKILKQSMEELGFKSLSSDAGVFIFRGEGSFVIAIIYVDDAIFCGPVETLVLKLKEAFMKRWECRDLGELKEFLRMRITRDGSKIHLDQCAYLRTVLERCGMTNAKATSTPLPTGYIPSKNESGTSTPELRSKYQTVIGSLLYLMLGTRPDISFAVTKLAQFSANPLQEHLDKALYICRYLVGTQDYRLTYNGTSKEGLIAVTDSDWASDNTTRRSTRGNHLLLSKL